MITFEKKIFLALILGFAAAAIPDLAAYAQIGTDDPAQHLTEKTDYWVNILKDWGARTVATIALFGLLFRVLIVKKADVNEVLWWVGAAAGAGSVDLIIGFMFTS